MCRWNNLRQQARHLESSSARNCRQLLYLVAPLRLFYRYILYIFYILFRGLLWRGQSWQTIGMWESALTGPNSRPRVKTLTVPEYSRRLLTIPSGITCDRTVCHSSGIAMHPVPSFCRNWDTAGYANMDAKKENSTRKWNQTPLMQCAKYFSEGLR